MADPAELVKLKLIFWHKGKVPGDIVEVRRDEVRSWYGYAVPVEDEAPAEPAKAEDSASAATGDDSTPAARKTATAAASKAK